MAVDRQVRQKRLDLGRTQRVRVALAVKDDEAFNEVDVGLLGANAVVLDPDLVPNAVEQGGSMLGNGGYDGIARGH